MKPFILALGLVPLLTSCSAPDRDQPLRPPIEGAVPDFSLSDRNPTSATFEMAVSPRDHLQRVSGWYFTQAT